MKLTAPISILLLLFYSCANMVAPSGGIKDATAPILLSVTENKTTTINELHFIFNEYIQLNNWEIVSVNPNDKLWDWKDLFCFWANNIQSLIAFSLIASLYLVYELNFLVVLLGLNKGDEMV